MRTTFILVSLATVIIIGCSVAEQELIDWTDALAALDCEAYDENRDGVITREELRLMRCTIVAFAGLQALTGNTEALNELADDSEDDWLDGLADLGCNVDYAPSDAAGPDCFADSSSGDGGACPDPELTIAMAPNLPGTVEPGDTITAEFDWTVYSGDTQPGSPTWINTCGWRNANGDWVAPRPIVFYEGTPGRCPGHAETSEVISIAAPVLPGTYTLWAHSFPTTSQSTAISQFESVRITAPTNVAKVLGAVPVARGGEGEDRDGDGTPDDLDGCPDDPNKTESGECGCGEPEHPATGTGAEPGTFGNPVYHDVFANPIGIAIADLDGDGDNDLAVAEDGAHGIRILLNSGCGTFLESQGYATGHYPEFVAAGDLDGDGDQDLVVTQASVCGSDCGHPIAGINVLLNQGNGTFAPYVNYGAQAIPGAKSIAIGDLDNDGDADLVVANQNKRLVVLFNNGESVFQAVVVYDAFEGGFSGPVAADVTIADLDGDGDLDLAFATHHRSDDGLNLGTVSILRNQGDGTFAEAEIYSAGDKAISIAAGDLDGDGDIDFAVVDWGVYQAGYWPNTSELFILRNNGDGTFANDATYPLPDASHSVVIADLDADGDNDVAVAGTGPCCDYNGTLSVLFNDGNAGFADRAIVATGKRFNPVAAGDLDMDGVADLAATICCADGNVALWFNGAP